LSRADRCPGEQLAEAEGSIQLSGDEKAMAAAMVVILKRGEEALVTCGSGFEVEDGGLQGEAKAFADVNGRWGNRRAHISSWQG
jgi:hypothetical protein